MDSSNNYQRDISPKNSRIIAHTSGSKIVINSPNTTILSNSQIRGDRQYVNSQQHIPINQPSYHQTVLPTNIQTQQTHYK